MTEVQEKTTTTDAPVEEEIPMSMPEKKALALTMVQAEGGISEEDFMSRLQLDKPSEKNMMFMILKAEGVNVVKEDGLLKGLDDAAYEEYVQTAQKKAAEPKPDYKDLDAKRQRHVNALGTKTRTLMTKRDRYQAKPTNKLATLEYQVASLNLQIAEIKYANWSAKAARDLKLESADEVRRIPSLDQYVIDNGLVVSAE